MIRNQFSYWLTAEPAEDATHTQDEVLSYLNTSALARPDGPMIFKSDNTGISGEVEPDWGSVEEDTSLQAHVAATAAAFPDWTFEFRENDEDDHAVMDLTRYANGAVVYEGSARTIEPGEFDKPTVDAIAKHLENNGFADAARSVLAEFGKQF